MLATGLMLQAQDPDLAAIAQMRKNKADSLSIMLGKSYGTQAAMNHPTAEARQVLLKAFNDALNIDNQDEDYKEGVSTAEQFYRNAEGMNKRFGINMSRELFAKSFLTRLNDTTATQDIRNEIQDLNNEASRIIKELTEIKKDSAAAIAQANLIDLKADTLSQNMGRFFGSQMQAISKKNNRSKEQMARFIDGFNSSLSFDENNKPLLDGKLLRSDFLNIQKSVKKQLELNLDKNIFAANVASVLNDPKVPTLDEFKAVDGQTQAYIQETQAFAKSTSPEALTQIGLGKKYIENLMEKDPGFIQTPSGLVYKMLVPGNGKKFSDNDKVRVMYKGTHVDGKTFDESKEPVAFAPNQVVPGFREALLMMSPGAKMIAVLPHNIAYGERGAGQAIKPYETLVFEIETLGIEGQDNVDVKKAAEEVKKDAQEAVENASKVATPSSTKKPSTKKSTSKKSSKRKK